MIKKEILDKLREHKVVWAVLIVVVVVCIVHFIHPAEYFVEGDRQVKNNLNQLNKKIASLDNNKIDSAISKASFVVKIKEAGGNKGQLDNRFVFSKSVLIGDSMAEGVVDYKILDNTNVFAKRGKRLETSGDLVSQAISARPENLFIEFGMNDLIAYRGKVEPFIKEYKSILKKIKKSLPMTNLYVVSINTIASQGISDNPSMKNFSKYNMALEKMCRDERIHYVDTTILMNGTIGYEFDGIHPKEPFYSNWVKLMCSYILEGSEV